MNINKYKVLTKVVELGSLTKAADELGFTQSGVSHIINSLEDEFGFSLLIRNRSGVRVTSNGETILKTIYEILKWHQHLEQEVASLHGLDAGVLQIGTFTSVSVQWLPGIIQDFQRDYPNIEIRLSEGDYTQIEEWIAEGKIDCGFLSLPTLDTFDAIHLHQDPLFVLLPVDHPLSCESSLLFSQLENETFVLLREGTDHDVRRILEQSSINPKSKYTLADDYAIMAMVEKGLGISILPELVLRGQRFNIRLVELTGHYRSLGIVVRSMAQVSPATKIFLKYVQNYPKL
ncbi:LysR family transcriptional regulator [Tumebacillus flagellatus]|uniref:LysR family transcriptional regulator n=1 Tax=Tumebacillus flagellatus TaxID=1157490 RepID=A0A074LP99_9BACL|nr:LysR substrate-binding domain-containing protein [Tumebacillus flagellatus]KEO82330.1 LysR family transcriptional regulator [Tumebacillus flagellatus]